MPIALDQHLRQGKTVFGRAAMVADWLQSPRKGLLCLSHCTQIPFKAERGFLRRDRANGRCGHAAVSKPRTVDAIPSVHLNRQASRHRTDIIYAPFGDFVEAGVFRKRLRNFDRSYDLRWGQVSLAVAAEE